MTHHSPIREAERSGKPAKPLTPLRATEGKSVADLVFSLAYASGCTRAESVSTRALYLKALREGGKAGLFFRRFWQQRTLAPLAPDAVLVPWATETHQRLASIFKERGLLGEEPLLLPCRNCGRLFTSKPPRFARTCKACKAPTPQGLPHERSFRSMLSAGFYRAGPYGPEQGQSVLCAHPDCLEFFLTHRSDRDYCPEHLGKWMAAARARARSRKPKYERFCFYPKADEPVRCAFMVSEAERVCVIDRRGYQAQHEAEFLQFLQLAAGTLPLLEVRKAEAAKVAPVLARPRRRA